MRTRFRSESGLIGKTLIFFLIFVAVAGIAVYDGGSIFLAKAKVSDTAHQAAFDGAGEYQGTANLNQAEQTAQQVAEAAGARLTLFEVDKSSGQVTVTLVKRADTLAVQRFSLSKGWGVVRETATSGPPTG